MSWPTWPATAPPIPAAAVSSIQSSLLPTAVNSAPSVLPPGLQYSPEQWAQAQQHNWQQWAQWQQQYQQWHQQYGAEYQKSLTAMHSTMTTVQTPIPTLANTAMAPPLPLENKPPLPPEEPPLNQASILSAYTSMSTKLPSLVGCNTAPSLITSQPPPVQQQSWEQKRPYVQEAEYQVKKSALDQWNSQKGISLTHTSYNQPPPQTIPSKVNAEELSEAEKKFDKEFAAWEAQFQKWKEQNANHPDKTQYREYEKKWESWRNSLLERREQMRKKRLALATTASGVSKVPNFSQPPPTINQQTTSLTTQQSSIQASEQHSSLPFNQGNAPTSPKKDNEINTGESFLGTLGSSGSIPGLDLVKDDCKDEDTDHKDEQSTGPDFDAISKGINSILGDQKLLNMLSLVTKHPPPAIGTQKGDFTTQPPPTNYLENQYGNMSFPPPTAPLRDHYNDQSNQSFEDRSNPGEYHQRESVTNFDDQTRSSFTLGPNDPDHFRHRSQLFRDEKLSGGFGTQKTNLQDTAPKSLLSLNFSVAGPKISQENYSSGGPEHLIGSRNNYGSSKNENCRQTVYRGLDTFNRFGSKYDGENYSKGNRMNNKFGISDLGLSQKNYLSNESDNNNFYEDSYRGRDGQNLSRDCNQEDDYNEEDDYDKFHSLFNEDGEGNQENFKSDNYNNRREHVNKRLENRLFSKDSLASSNGLPSKQSVLQDFTVSAQPKVEETFAENSIFAPVKVIDYDHKSLSQTDVDITVEPIHMFDYRHKSVNRIPLSQRPEWLSDCVKFIREFDPLASRMYERSSIERSTFDRDRLHHDFNRESKEYVRGRKDYDRDNRMYERDHRKYESKNERKFERINKFDDDYDSYIEKDRKRLRLDSNIHHGNKNCDNNDEKINLKDALEELSDEDMDWEVGDKHKPQNQSSDENKSRSSSPILSNPPNPSNTFSEIQLIEDIIYQPGRFNRPPRIVIILRGPPGSGKTYLARLIKDKEVENGGSAPRILSLDDYFMVEHEKSVVEDGKNVTVKDLVYEYEADMEESYRSSFIKSFKKTVTDGYFPFIIVDNINDKVKYFGEMWSFAKQNGFQVYICQLDLDPILCTKRNIHNRTEAEIEECIAGWEPTPSHHPTIDATSFLQSNLIKEVEMEVVNEIQLEPKQDESAEGHVRSKWDTFDYSSNNLAKLDGVSKPLRRNRTMEEYLQMEEQWKPTHPSKPGQKRVRWADLEEHRELEKMKDLGFVVGHTDWERILDPTTAARRALTQTKYI